MKLSREYVTAAAGVAQGIADAGRIKVKVKIGILTVLSGLKTETIFCLRHDRDFIKV